MGLKQISIRFCAVTLLSVAVVGLVFGVRQWLKSQETKSTDSLSSPAAQAPNSVTDDMRKKAVRVEPASIESYVKAPGMVDFHPKHALRIHPTFPGVIVRVYKNLGDSVAVGEGLATVEGNVGVQTFTVSSPIKGIVLAKNIGEGQSVSQEDEVYSVGDASVLQARIAISARDIKHIKKASEVILLAENRPPVRSQIAFLSPILSEDTRTAPAIVNIINSGFRPGMFVTGAIVIASTMVPLSLPVSFCGNSIKNSTVAVLTESGFDHREVQFGTRDYFHCEIVSGLKPGESVVPISLMEVTHGGKGQEHADE